MTEKTKTWMLIIGAILVAVAIRMFVPFDGFSLPKFGKKTTG